MLALEERAREIEIHSPDVLAVNVLAGFPYADVPEAGASFSAVTSGRCPARLRQSPPLASPLAGAYDGPEGSCGPLQATLAILLNLRDRGELDVEEN